MADRVMKENKQEPAYAAKISVSIKSNDMLKEMEASLGSLTLFPRGCRFPPTLGGGGKSRKELF